MSGHSKWNTIKRKKEKTDSNRAKIFTKIGRELAVAVRDGGGADLNTNFKLRECVAKAKQNNVPNENIERIIKKAAGDGKNNNFQSIIYEGYGPCGTAFIMESLTDNKNRTAGNLRHIFDKHGGNLGASGCVTFMFSEKGIIIIEKENLNEEIVMEDALLCNASDFSTDDENFIIQTEKIDFFDVIEKLRKKNYKFLSAEIEMVPKMYVNLASDEDADNFDNLINALENDDDVQNIWHNRE
jgi:YebC/PmpR family DNA-binding regulatory protein